MAAALIRNRLEEFRIQTQTKIVEYDSNTVVNIEDWKVSFFRVTHSIPDSFGVCVVKPEGRVVDITPSYVGGLVPNEFVVGYGLDYNEYYRNLPYIGVLKEEVYSK